MDCNTKYAINNWYIRVFYEQSLKMRNRKNILFTTPTYKFHCL